MSEFLSETNGIDLPLDSGLWKCRTLIGQASNNDVRRFTEAFADLILDLSFDGLSVIEHAFSNTPITIRNSRTQAFRLFADMAVRCDLTEAFAIAVHSMPDDAKREMLCVMKNHFHNLIPIVFPPAPPAQPTQQAQPAAQPVDRPMPMPFFPVGPSSGPGPQHQPRRGTKP